MIVAHVHRYRQIMGAPKPIRSHSGHQSVKANVGTMTLLRRPRLAQRAAMSSGYAAAHHHSAHAVETSHEVGAMRNQYAERVRHCARLRNASGSMISMTAYPTLIR